MSFDKEQDEYMRRGMTDLNSPDARAVLYGSSRTTTKGMELNFRDLNQIARELGEDAFKDMAPRMYEIYKEMKTISAYKKLSEILEDN